MVKLFIGHYRKNLDRRTDLSKGEGGCSGFGTSLNKRLSAFIRAFQGYLFALLGTVIQKKDFCFNKGCIYFIIPPPPNQKNLRNEIQGKKKKQGERKKKKGKKKNRERREGKKKRAKEKQVRKEKKEGRKKKGGKKKAEIGEVILGDTAIFNDKFIWV